MINMEVLSIVGLEETMKKVSNSDLNVMLKESHEVKLN